MVVVLKFSKRYREIYHFILGYTIILVFRIQSISFVDSGGEREIYIPKNAFFTKQRNKMLSAAAAAAAESRPDIYTAAESVHLSKTNNKLPNHALSFQFCRNVCLIYSPLAVVSLFTHVCNFEKFLSLKRYNYYSKTLCFTLKSNEFNSTRRHISNH